MNRSQFVALLNHAKVVSNYSLIQVRALDEAVRTYGEHIEALLAENQTQAAFDFLRDLGVLLNPARPADVVVTQPDYQNASVAFTGPGDSFDLFRALAENADDWPGGYESVATGATSPLADTTLLPDTSYGYRVQATAAGVVSVPSQMATLDPSLPVPQVLNLAATSVAQPVLTWDAVAPAPDEYVVLRDSIEIDRTATLTFTDLTAAPGTTYSYTVRASHNGTGGQNSDPAEATTPAVGIPQNVAATSVAAPVVTWDAVVPADSYNLYRDGGILETGATSGHVDSTAAAATTYQYSVTAVYLGVEGAASADAPATTP